MFHIKVQNEGIQKVAAKSYYFFNYSSLILIISIPLIKNRKV